MEKRAFIGNCVTGLDDDLFREYIADDSTLLAQLVENSKEISKKIFLKHCYIDRDIEKQFKKSPQDYTFYKNGNIYFYEWSAIEHFYC